MEGIIKIEDYKVHCIIGAHAHERKVDQELSIDIEMKVDMTEAVLADSLVDTVDYEAICAVCKELALARRYHLLETFAYETLHALLDSFPISWAKIRIRKPGAIPLAKHALVELEKERS